MKKLCSLFATFFAVFLLSVTSLADVPEKLFTVKVNDGFSFEEIAAYAEENGFSAVVLDFRQTPGSNKLVPPGSGDVPYYLLDSADGLSTLKGFWGGSLCRGTLCPAEDFSEGNADGIYLSYGDETAFEKAADLCENGKCGLIFAENPLSSYSAEGYKAYLSRCRDAFKDAKLITVNDLSRVLSPVVTGDFFGDAYELNNQYLINSENGVSFCVSDYDALIKNRNGSASYLISGFSSDVLEEYADFSISQKFAITRPTGTTLVTDYSQYTIFGTSDPTKPLYMDGVAIDRISTTGLFSATVPVPKKGRTYNFSQGSRTISVTLSQTGTSGGGDGTTKKISSAEPSSNRFFEFGDTLTLSCIGPSGAKITAYFGGKTYSMKQVAYADPGIPAKFKTEPIELNDSEKYPSGTITNAGTVTYTLFYNGETKNTTAGGTVYVRNGDVPIVIRANCELAGIEREPIKQGDYLTTLRTGCTDLVTDVTDGWYKLSSGGYISIEQADVFVEKTSVSNEISSFDRETGERYEKLIFHCSALPYFSGEISGKTFRLKLSHTTCADLSEIKKDDDLVHSIRFTAEEDGSTTVTISSLETIWGWDVFTDEENQTFTLVLKSAPKLAPSLMKPLSGITVAVCSGHGGPDPGALSVAGEKGVNEAEINLANTMAIADSLERLGADVLLLVSDGTKFETYGRTDPARKALADAYVCCHANSVDFSAKADLWCGTEVYYHYPHSAVFSQKLVDYISAATKRDNEGSIQDYYSVTRLTICPAVMLEVGFVSNPSELESLVDHGDIQKTALAVTKAIMEIMDN